MAQHLDHAMRSRGRATNPRERGQRLVEQLALAASRLGAIRWPHWRIQFQYIPIHVLKRIQQSYIKFHTAAGYTFVGELGRLGIL